MTARVDSLQECFILGHDRMAKVEAAVHRAQKNFEEQVAGTIATSCSKLQGQLEQFTLSYDRQLKEIRQVIDGVNTLQCETARSVGEVSKTVGEVSKAVDGVAMHV